MTASRAFSTQRPAWWAATGWLASGHAATVSLRLLALVIVGRGGRIESIGVVVVGLAIASGLAMLFSGTQTVGIIETSRQPRAARPIRDRAVRQQLAIGAVGYAAVLVVLVVSGADHVGVLALFGLSAFVQGVTLRWLLVALGEARFAAMAFAAGAFVFLVGCVAVVDADALWRIAAVHLVAEMGVAAALWWRVDRVAAPSPNVADIDLGLARGLRLSVLQFCRILPITVSVFVVAVVVGAIDAGRFALPQRAAFAVFALAALHTEAGTAPLIGRHGSARRLAEITVPVVVAAVLGAGVVWLVADPVAELVLDDEQYRGLGPTAALLVLALGVALLSGPRMQLGVAGGQDRYLLTVSVMIAAATIGLMVLLTASAGLVGVGIAELAGQIAFLVAVIGREQR